jgi:hypothetical protein
MMAFTLAKAVENVQAVVGDKGISQRNYFDVQINHSPLSAIPGLRNFFEEYTKGEGGKRTVQMMMGLYHSAGKSNVYGSGSVFKSITDMSDPDTAYFSLEIENDQSWLFGKEPIDGSLSE